MNVLIVVNNINDWPMHTPGAELVSARSYLTHPHYSQMRRARVFNLCRSYRYQSTGYYVSLLAAARGHKPQPSITAIQDMKSLTMVRMASDDLEEMIQKNLASITSDKFTLSVYFGKNLAKKYDALSHKLFQLFQVPLFRAQFTKEDDEWSLTGVAPVAASEVPEEHRAFIVKVGTEFFSGKGAKMTKPTVGRYDLAILYNETDKNRPSNPKAIQYFTRAAEALGFDVETIEKDDYGRLAEFDALFIRETTSVNHHTFRFAQRAQAEGLVVVDDPESILKCSNKVYLAELMGHNKVPQPRTMIVHRDNHKQIKTELGLPVILKQPDSYFSQGVIKVDNEEQLAQETERLFDKSDLFIAQEFLPTAFDWRIGVFDRQPLFACKYFMAKSHWQIVKSDKKGERDYGDVEPFPIDQVPPAVMKMALKAANLVGDGLYGVDMKQIGDRVYVIEVNDNPNIDAGYEDAILKKDLYTRIMQGLLTRIERRHDPSGSKSANKTADDSGPNVEPVSEMVRAASPLSSGDPVAPTAPVEPTAATSRPNARVSKTTRTSPHRLTKPNQE